MPHDANQVFPFSAQLGSACRAVAPFPISQPRDKFVPVGSKLQCSSHWCTWHTHAIVFHVLDSSVNLGAMTCFWLSTVHRYSMFGAGGLMLGTIFVILLLKTTLEPPTVSSPTFGQRRCLP